MHPNTVYGQLMSVDRINPASLWFCVLAAILCSCNAKVSQPSAVGPIPSDAQLKWHEMETSAFIHFSINTFTDNEWGFGAEDPKRFNPTDANVEQWIVTLKDAGFKGLILTTKHHDGFCLWPSHYTSHSIAGSPYKNGKGDIVKEVSDACKKHGLKFGIYVSPWDRNRADYGDASYVEFYRNQLKELFTSYGPIFEMWFDGANGGDGYYGGSNERRSINGATYYDWPTTLNLVREMDPNVIFFSDAGPGVRWVGNEKGIAGEMNWNTITPDTLYAGKAGIEQLLNMGSENGTAWIPAEVDVSIRPGWFYHEREDSLVKSAEQLFDIYLTSVGRGSTLLLNVPPDKRGLIHERDVQVLRQWKALRDREFGKDLAREARIKVDTYRGDHKAYGASTLNDGDNETYWATDDDQLTGSITLEFNSAQAVKYIVLQEYIKLGQRIKNFVIESFDGKNWIQIGSGTTIGYKRIQKVDPVTTNKIRIKIQQSKACPLVSNVEVY